MFSRTEHSEGQKSRSQSPKKTTSVLKTASDIDDMGPTQSNVTPPMETAPQHAVDKAKKMIESNEKAKAKATGTSTDSMIKTPVELRVGHQEKHIPGSKNFILEYKKGNYKSEIDGSIQEIQQLLNDFATKGTPLNNNKERVDFGKKIGKYYNEDDKKYYDTTVGIIHYAKKGAHIVPARPLKE